MRKIWFAVCLAMYIPVFPQNVGIGTSTPSATLDVIRGNAGEGTLRIQGTQHYSHFNYSSTEYTYIRAGLDHSHVILNDVLGGGVGVGVIPQQNLSVRYGMNIDQDNSNNGTVDNSVLRFGSESGEAIGSPRTGGSNNQYGLDFYTGFLKRMVITNGGNVGIGNSDPSFKLDVSNRMRVRSGGDNNNSAGIYFNNNANNLAAFVGMQDDTNVGFWGSSIGWGLTMNTQTGALKINGSTGTAGQVLRSNGSSASAWANLPDDYNNLTITSGATTVAVPTGATFVAIPGLTKTLNLAGLAKVKIDFSIRAAASASAPTLAGIRLQVNGGPYGLFQYTVGGITYLTGSTLITLGAGSYTLSFLGDNNCSSGCSTVTFGASETNFIVQIISQ